MNNGENCEKNKKAILMCGKGYEERKELVNLFLSFGVLDNSFKSTNFIYAPCKNISYVLRIIKKGILELKKNQKENDLESELLLLFDAHGNYQCGESYIKLGARDYVIKDIYIGIKKIITEIGFTGKIYAIHGQCSAGGIKQIINNGDIPDNLTIGYMSSKKDPTYNLWAAEMYIQVLKIFDKGEDLCIGSTVYSMINNMGLNFYIPTAETSKENKIYSKNKYILGDIMKIIESIDLFNDNANAENYVIKEVQSLILNKIKNSFMELKKEINIDDGIKIKKKVVDKIQSIFDIKLLLFKIYKKLGTDFLLRENKKISSRKDLKNIKIKYLDDKIKKIIFQDENLMRSSLINFVFSKFYTSQILLGNSKNGAALLENPEVFKKILGVIENTFDDESMAILLKIIFEKIKDIDGDKLKFLLKNSVNIVKLMELNLEIFEVIIEGIKNISIDKLNILWRNSENIFKLQECAPEIFKNIMSIISSISNEELKVFLLQEIVEGIKDIGSDKLDVFALENSENIFILKNTAPQLLEALILNIKNIDLDKLRFLLENSESIVSKFNNDVVEFKNLLKDINIIAVDNLNLNLFNKCNFMNNIQIDTIQFSRK